MCHYARRSQPGTALFTSWMVARFLWEALEGRVPGIVALTLMPDHLHLLTVDRVEAPLALALRAFALWRNAA